ncbi:hypothetical protein FACS189474_3700 [Bacteroidia bacterium]|nr:hypothetical protein FACS189474_3700 [Bacteroidia bacterium]
MKNTTNKSRRDFITKAVSGSVAAMVAPAVFAGENAFTREITSTEDVFGAKRLNFEWVPMDFTIRKMPDVAAVAVDSKDNIYYTTRICPGFGTHVVVLDPQGKYLRGIGTAFFKNAHGIAIDKEDNLYVVDTGAHCLYKFKTDGTLLATIGNPNQPSDSGCINMDFRTIQNSAGPFNFPSKLAIADNGELFVADGYGNARIHHFSKDGKLLNSWGEPGNGKGEFNVPHGIAVDPDGGDIYVCDRENERIQIFDQAGKLKTIWNDIWRPCELVIRDGFAYVAELGELFYLDNVLYQPGTKHHHSQIRVFDIATGKVAAQIGTADSGEHGSFFALHCITLTHKNEILAGEVNFPREDAWISYPEGRGMSHKFHPSLQKFKPV